ncbi:MAG: T9SS type A sorting domain-containing protein, partial [Fibrobacteria bacterium]|nr:T9SS type A sorting domain-containing protein [Fibrobacteria bacterium]
SEAIASRQDKKGGTNIEPYLGTIEDFYTKLTSFAGPVVSGCMNEEPDKRDLSKGIIYATCSGYSNQYAHLGETAPDNPSKAVNEYIIQADFDSVTRKWIGHGQNTNPMLSQNLISLFKSTAAGDSTDKIVFGMVNHSMKNEVEYFNNFLDTLHEYDPLGEKSRTVSEVMKEGILPVENFEMIDNKEMKPKLTPVVSMTQKVFSAYPHLVGDNLWFDGPNMEGQGYTLKISTLQGKIIKVLTTHALPVQYDVNALPAGVYQLIVRNEKAHVFVTRFIKQ